MQQSKFLEKLLKITFSLQKVLYTLGLGVASEKTERKGESQNEIK